jgi:hypothetical protein
MKIQILAQVKENYGTAQSPHWKNKGAAYFETEADEDIVMYAPNLEGTLAELLKQESNEYFSYEYVDHDVIWSVRQLDRQQLEDMILKAHENS